MYEDEYDDDGEYEVETARISLVEPYTAAKTGLIYLHLMRYISNWNTYKRLAKNIFGIEIRDDESKMTVDILNRIMVSIFDDVEDPYNCVFLCMMKAFVCHYNLTNEFSDISELHKLYTIYLQDGEDCSKKPFITSANQNKIIESIGVELGNDMKQFRLDGANGLLEPTQQKSHDEIMSAIGSY